MCVPYFSQVLRHVPAGEEVLTEVVLSGSGRMLFAGGSSGCVRSLKFPLTDAGEFTEHQAHSASVTKVCPGARGSSVALKFVH